MKTDTHTIVTNTLAKTVADIGADERRLLRSPFHTTSQSVTVYRGDSIFLEVRSEPISVRISVTDDEVTVNPSVRLGDLRPDDIKHYADFLDMAYRICKRIGHAIDDIRTEGGAA